MSKKLNFGPMDEKCFISRSELLQWINNLLLVSVTRVEQLGCGSIYCQLFDVIYPGKIPLNKLKWKAKHEYEFSHNFKLLQKGFDSVNVAKVIPIEKLVKAKYQDNLEFAQWMKRFFEINCKDKGRSYDPKKRRGMAEPDLSFCVGGVLPQYTMIYGNFKDMDREIITITKESENESGSKKSSSNESSPAVDKENINTSNISVQKQSLANLEPAIQKRLNLGDKQSVLKESRIGDCSSEKNTQASVVSSTSVSSQSNLPCPFFLNDNQITKKPPMIKFQTSVSNKNLIKSLENNEDQNSSQSVNKQNGATSDGSTQKLQQIKQLLSLINTEDKKNAPDPFSLLAQIKSLVQ